MCTQRRCLRPYLSMIMMMIDDDDDDCLVPGCLVVSPVTPVYADLMAWCVREQGWPTSLQTNLTLQQLSPVFNQSFKRCQRVLSTHGTFNKIKQKNRLIRRNRTESNESISANRTALHTIRFLYNQIKRDKKTAVTRKATKVPLDYVYLSNMLSSLSFAKRKNMQTLYQNKKNNRNTHRTKKYMHSRLSNSRKL